MHVRKSFIGIATAIAVIPAGTAFAATINGGPLGENLRGTRVADHIDGNGGNDRIHGFGGDDVLIGGPGIIDAATAAVRDADRDEESLSLTVPGDGSLRSLRALLDQLDRAQVEVEDLSIHTPDLDDVFFAVTGSRKGDPA